METRRSIHERADGPLVSGLKLLVAQERRHLALILAHIAEVDDRRLFAPLGYPAMFAFCAGELCYSEGAAARRISAARAARSFPEIYSMISDGLISLSAVAALHSHLSPENRHELLARAQGLGRRGLERLVAELNPGPDTRDRIWRLPAGPSAAPDPGKEKMRHFAPRRVRFSFAADETCLSLVDRIRELLRHKHPAGKLGDILREAVEAFLDARDPERRLARKERASGGNDSAQAAPESGISGAGRNSDGRRCARAIPQRVRDAVWKRDGGACAFVGTDGRRCGERAWLEYDHVIPWAMGGRSNDPRNVRLLCRTHNQHAAKLTFGPKP